MRQTDEVITAHCDKHGDYEARKTGAFTTQCPACRTERETEFRERERARILEQQRADYERRREGWLADCGAVGRFRGATFDSFRAETKAQQEIAAVCETFVDEFPLAKPLWLLGNVGTGKTLLGSAMVQEFIRRHHQRAMIATPRDIIRRLRDTWRKDADEREQDVLNDYIHCPLVVLDEVGASFGTDAEIVQLYDLVDGRYRHEKATVVISNLAAGDLRTILGDRIFDRLREGARVLVLDWPSYRGRAPV